MLRRFALNLIPIVLLLGSCSASTDDSANTTTTEALPTTTTLDAVALKEQAKSELLTELFKNTQWVNYQPHPFFANVEELQLILREFGIFGDIVPEWAGIAAVRALQLQRELCDDWLLEDLIAELEPTQTVGRFFGWNMDSTDVLTNDAVLAQGGMNIFQIQSAEKLKNLEGRVADNFAARGGDCKAVSNFYRVRDAETFGEKFEETLTTQWWTEQQLLDIPFDIEDRDLRFDVRFGKQDSDFGLGFRVLQVANGDNWIRNFSLIPFPELGLLVVTELNIYMNATSSGSMTEVEFAETYTPALSKLQTEMFGDIFGYILANGL